MKIVLCVIDWQLQLDRSYQSGKSFIYLFFIFYFSRLEKVEDMGGTIIFMPPPLKVASLLLFFFPPFFSLVIFNLVFA